MLSLRNLIVIGEDQLSNGLIRVAEGEISGLVVKFQVIYRWEWLIWWESD